MPRSDPKKFLTSNLDFAVLTPVILGFGWVAAQRLGTVPIPDDGDESMTLQVPYELLNRGVFGWPMYRYLGGNIENAWHSFRPAYYWMLTGFFKLFGWGLPQGRAFNLIMSLLVLLTVYVIGRRLIDWRVGMTAVLLLVADSTFLERSRMVRHDFAAAMFALLAWYLYELAEQRKAGRFYVASGLAAGAGVLCHTNGIYMLGVICLLMLLRHGLRIFSSTRIYLFLGGAAALMAYEVISDLIDLTNVRFQYRGDKAHFSVFSPSGWWDNILREIERYREWYSGSNIFPNVPHALLHLFQFLAVIALVYLFIVCAKRIKGSDAFGDPRTRIFIVTVCAMLFLAITTGRKRKQIQYLIHLTPWLALCAGILVRDVWARIRRLKQEPGRTARLVTRVAMPAMVLVLIVYWTLLLRQNKKYLDEVNNPDQASFAEFTDALRSIVPDGLCPASVTRPVVWLAFPESDRCYVSIEGRMADAVDIDGKDYALMIPSKKNPEWIKDPDVFYTLLGQMENTPYGDIRVYYTGTESRFKLIPARRFTFFGRWNGHATEEQFSAAREVWSADGSQLQGNAKQRDGTYDVDEATTKRAKWSGLREICAIDLQPRTIYELKVNTAQADRWEFVAVDELTGARTGQTIADGQTGSIVKVPFRTLEARRVKILARPLVKEEADPLTISRVTICEVAPID